MRLKRVAQTASFMLAATACAGAFAQTAPDQSGQVQGVDGIARAAVLVEPGNFATLLATARVSGGKPAGDGVLERAGDGVDIYVNAENCSADRDIRRQVDPASFQGTFASSATCLTVLGPGEHEILAQRTSINTTGATIVLRHTILGGTTTSN